MNIREEMEKREHEYLSEYATFSDATKGREYKEEECDIRTVFQRDRDRILHSKAFRRMKHKTQVFLSPEGDHYRTRLTHTLEVAQTARTIAKALHLNDDLVEAIALGHDLGHTPFGHAGERALDEICPYGFEHSEQSVRVVELLEKKGKGLNLTAEVRDGIRNHQTAGMPFTLEGKIVRFCDKIAYINHDIDDSIRAGILEEDMLPKESARLLGNSTRERLNTMIHDIVIHSRDKNDIVMSEEIYNAMQKMRSFMFAKVYGSPMARLEEQKAGNMLKAMYEYYEKHFEELPQEFVKLLEVGEKKERIICDYIAGMTDSYAILKFGQLYIPKAWKG